MKTGLTPEVAALMAERFGHDSVMAVATVDTSGAPHVRSVDALYLDGAFYTVTSARSGKMRQIAADPRVSICGEWFTASGVGENLGHVRAPENAAIMERVRLAFAGWYSNGHTDESDPATCLLRVRPLEGVLFWHGRKFEIDFTSSEAAPALDTAPA